MKFISNSIFYSILLFLIIGSSQYSSCQGFLHRDNKKIVEGNGNEIILKGMGLGGWMLQEPYMMETSSFAGTQFAIKAKISDLVGEDNMNEFYDGWLANHCTRADIDSMAKWGFNSIRLPMHYNLFTLPIEKELVAGQNTWLDKGFVLVDSLLKWCTANGMYLILDLHAAPGGQGHDAGIADYDNTKPSLWESAANRAKTVELWKKIALRYSNNNWIGGYDLLNEPNWDLAGGVALKQLYTDIIAAIRQVDTNHLIFIEGNWFANDFTGLLPTTPGSPLMDQNMAYSFHKYWNSTVTGSIQWMLDIRNNFNVPLWLGESGENSNEWFNRTIKMLEDNKIGWSWWPLKKIGTIVGPATIVETVDYRSLLTYWEKGGTKPTIDFAKITLMQIAENAKIQNCIMHPDVIDAMFRQVKQSTRIPFKNLTIPGTIAISDYDMGKVNIAYWDQDYMNDKETSTEWNKGSAYRNDGVDIEKCEDTQYSNGYNVGWTNKNEWMKYTVNVTQTGIYDVLFRVANTDNAGLFHVEVNGMDVTGTVEAPNSGGHQIWQSLTISNIPLIKGVDTLTFKVDQGGFNISSMTWTGPSAISSLPLRLLSAITTEDGKSIYLTFSDTLKEGLSLSASSFKLSKDITIAIASIEPNKVNTKQIILHISGSIQYADILTLSYTGTSIIALDGRVLADFTNKKVINNMLATQAIPGKIEAESFTENYGFSAENCTDIGGGKDMGFSDAGDYLDYLVYIQEAGTYIVDYRYSTPDNNTKAELSLMDVGIKTVLQTIDFTATGDWQKWSNKTISVNLPAGLRRIRITVNTARFNTNYMNFVKSTNTSTDFIPDTNHLEIYPNPSNGILYLKPTLNLGESVDIQAIDIFGKINYRQIIKNQNNSLQTIDLSCMAKGIYIIKIGSGKYLISKKVIIN